MWINDVYKVSLYAVSEEILSVLLFLLLYEIIIIVEIICLYWCPIGILWLFIFFLCDFFEQIIKFLIKCCLLIWFLRYWSLFLWISLRLYFWNITLIDKIFLSFIEFVLKLLELFLIVFYYWSLVNFPVGIWDKFIAVLKLSDNLLSCSLWFFLLWPVKNHLYFLTNIKTFVFKIFKFLFWMLFKCHLCFQRCEKIF